jgi:hypothetical protein
MIAYRRGPRDAGTRVSPSSVVDDKLAHATGSVPAWDTAAP